MKPFLALAAMLCLCSCQTKLFYPNGQLAMSTGANATHMTMKGGGMEWRADDLNHSVPTRAAGAVLGNAATGLSGIITAQAAAGLLGGR